MYAVGMGNIQYTIRNIPEDLDKRLRLRSQKSGQTFNTTLIQALRSAMTPHKLAGPAPSDIDWFYGSGGLGEEELKAFAEQRVVDKKAWKTE
jgi:plasmid stability protein